MWLLKLHLAFSILCLLTFIGFRSVFRASNAFVKNGWSTGEKEKMNISGYLIFFYPIVNVLTVLTEIIMGTVTKEKFNKYCNVIKEEPEDE